MRQEAGIQTGSNTQTSHQMKVIGSSDIEAVIGRGNRIPTILRGRLFGRINITGTGNHLCVSLDTQEQQNGCNDNTLFHFYIV